MKSMLLALSLLMVGSLSNASEECVPAAQLRAKATIVAKSEIGCKVSVSLSSIELYLPAQSACPLQLDEVLASGIDVGVVNGHICDIPADGIINNILIKDASGAIVIDKY